MTVMRIGTTVLGTLLAVSAASCSGNGTGDVYPVKGTVLYRGKPAVGARVVFIPLGESETRRPVPQATVEEDGSFRLSSYTQHDGAAPGRYAVTISWPSDRIKAEDGSPAGPDRLGRRYDDRRKTPFQVEVGPNENELEPFRVQ
jgi:hypothetical protein